ncbi:hypothetical protein ACUHMQ_17255 [Chitinimonas sp. PSY-7]|uniref:hypothetical protein n=1 Tax=Chitinimonas sp. PSY-7 TaxID=3459088 RepID=UPI0040402B92
MRLRHRRERCDQLAARIVLRKAVVHQSWANCRQRLEELLTSYPLAIAIGAAAGTLLVTRPRKFFKLMAGWPMLRKIVEDMWQASRAAPLPSNGQVSKS